MKIVCKLGQPLPKVAGAKEVAVEVPGDRATVAAALEELFTQIPKLRDELFARGEPARFYYTLFLNDRLLRFAEASTTPVQDGDVLLILLPVAGG
jgi:molybdopterin converting factor small subunit